MYNLNSKDRQILWQLEKNCRQSSSQIGKKTKLSLEVVNYRIKKLEENQVINHYMTIIDHSRLGLMQFKIYLQLQHLKKEKKTELINELKKIKEIKWIAECNGTWDLIIAIITKNIQDFERIKIELFAKFDEFAAKKSITLMSSAFTSRRKYLSSEKYCAEEEALQLAGTEEEKTDKTDLKILETISENARIPTTKLSKATGLSPRIIRYRIRQLEKKKIIRGYRTSINLEKIGYNFFKLFICLEKAERKRIDELIRFCNYHNNIIHNVTTIGDWEIESEVETETNEQFYGIINELKEKFSDIIKTTETTTVIKEHKFVYF